MDHFFVDTETDNSKGFGLDPFRSKIVTFQCMSEDGECKIIQNPADLEEFRYELENNIVVMHNAKFDCKFIRQQFGITIPHVYDTMIAEQIISGGILAGYAKGKSLKDVTLKYCGVERDKSCQNSFDSGEELTDEQIEYLLDDLRYLPIIMKKQQAQIKKLGLERILEIEMKAIPAFAWLELSGINVDLEKLAEIKIKTLEEKEKVYHELREALIVTSNQSNLMGERVVSYPNLNSNKELLGALQKKGLKLISTADEELSKFGDNPLIKKVQKYRKATKKLSSFIETLPGFINPTTGRIHSDFSQYGTLSGRIASSKPNMQQQPHTNDWRQIFSARPGYVIISADYSQIELRILGEVSNDTEFIKSYNNKLDLHRVTASKIFKMPYDDVTDEQRSKSKAINFGIAYGIYIYGLINSLAKSGITVTEDEAKEMIDGFYTAYPGVSDYLRNASTQGLSNLETRTLAGRLFKFNQPHNKKEEGEIKRQSRNLPIQGLCADMVKIAIGNLVIRLKNRDVKFINFVHDELVMELKDEESEEIIGIVKEEMEKAGRQFLKKIPCIAEVKKDTYWKK